MNSKKLQNERMMDEFRRKYPALDNDHKYIVFETLSRMNYNRMEKQNLLKHSIIRKKMRQLGIGESELLKQVQKIDPTISYTTLDSYLKRKYKVSDVQDAVFQVLGIQKRSYTSFLAQASFKIRADQMFNKLHVKDKQAILYLIHLLKMSRYNKEYFTGMVNQSTEINPIKTSWLLKPSK